MVWFLYQFHICSWQPVNLLVNECEAGGGDRILFVCELFFFFFFFLLTYCVYLHTCISGSILLAYMQKVCLKSLQEDAADVCVDSMWCIQCVFVNFVTCFGHYVVFVFFFRLLRFLRVAWEVVRLIKFCSVLFCSVDNILKFINTGQSRYYALVGMHKSRPRYMRGA